MRCCTAFVIVGQFTYIDPISQKLFHRNAEFNEIWHWNVRKKTDLSQKQQASEWTSNTFLLMISCVLFCQKLNSYETFFLFVFFFDCLCPTFGFDAKTIVSFFSTWIDLTCVYLSNLRIIFALFDFTHKSLKKWPRNENKWKKYLLQFRYTVRYFFLSCFSLTLHFAL